MNKILVVEDETITSDLLRRYFEMVGYEVINAMNGASAIRTASEQQPEVIILDIMLPDMDGYEICKQLRTDERTKRIPIIFLTQKDERRDRLDGLGMGADDYITKPFDVEELRLRVHNIIHRMGGTPQVDPRTSLPNMALIKERLPQILEHPDAVFLDVEIAHLIPYIEKHGPVRGNQVIRNTARLIGDILREIDPTGSFIGHPRDDHFLIVLTKEAADVIERELPERFRKQVEQFYSSEALAQDSMQLGDRQVPLMLLKLLRIKPAPLRALLAIPGGKKVADQQSETPPKPEPEPAVRVPVPEATSGGAKPSGESKPDAEHQVQEATTTTGS